LVFESMSTWVLQMCPYKRNCSVTGIWTLPT
jgi:hypothetical protein